MPKPQEEKEENEGNRAEARGKEGKELSGDLMHLSPRISPPYRITKNYWE